MSEDLERWLKGTEPDEILRLYLEARSGVENIEDELPVFFWEEALEKLVGLTKMAEALGEITKGDTKQ